MLPSSPQVGATYKSLQMRRYAYHMHMRFQHLSSESRAAALDETSFETYYKNGHSQPIEAPARPMHRLCCIAAASVKDLASRFVVEKWPVLGLLNSKLTVHHASKPQDRLQALSAILSSRPDISLERLWRQLIVLQDATEETLLVSMLSL